MKRTTARLSADKTVLPAELIKLGEYMAVKSMDAKAHQKTHLNVRCPRFRGHAPGSLHPDDEQHGPDDELTPPNLADVFAAHKDQCGRTGRQERRRRSRRFTSLARSSSGIFRGLR